MKNTYWIIFFLSLAAPGSSQHTSSANSNKPNVLFISVDDLNDWINTNSWNGRPGLQTPNFNRLAKMSMSFTNCQVASPACAPSRVAVMTGVHPVKSGITGWRNPEWRKVPALQKVETIEQFFKARGYSTLAGGKIYHTLAPPRDISNQSEASGWDFYFPSVQVPIPYQVRAPKDSITIKNRSAIQQPDYFSWAPIPLDDKYMADYQIVDWANYELSQPHDKPLFLAVGLTKPHDPWEVPQKYFDLYPLDSIRDVEIKKNDLIDAWGHGRRPLDKFIVDNKQTKKVIQAYMATISFTDAMLGRLLDGFEKSRYKTNTIIVLWSDHGMHMGEKENWEKFTLWERSLRAPLFFMAPGITKPGSSTHVPVGVIDVFPTLAELVGEKPPAYCSGESLVPMLKGIDFTHKPVLSAYEIRDSIDGKPYDAYTIRTKGYRYIYYPPSGLEELYDHEVDKNEWDNIAYKPGNKKLIAHLRGLLLQQVPNITWSTNGPKGYKILEDGTIQKLNYIPIEYLKQTKWWL
ncbi:MAG: sulfatase [Chitinophagaceae bacterium]